MGLIGLLKDFSGWTSAHGIPQIGSGRNMLIRLIWIVLYCGFLGMFGYQLYSMITKYFKYGIVVSTDIKFDQRHFPAVTVCSLNPYKKSQLSASPELQELMVDYRKVLKAQNKFNTNITGDDKFGFNNKANPVHKQSLARIAMVYIVRNMTDEAWQKLTYEMTELILECRFGSNKCNLTDFEQSRDPFYGACYTFNYKQPPTYSNSRSGSQFGLNLLVKVEQKEFLPVAETAAYRVTVHDQGSEPFPDAFGYNAGAGFVNSLGTKFSTTIRLQKPYGDCTKKKEEVSAFYYDRSNYSMEACFRSCYQLKIIEKCGCSDPRFSAKPNSVYCGVDKSTVSCVNDVATVKAKDCDCRQPCSDTTYSVTASQSYWPQRSNLPGLSGSKIKEMEDYACADKKDEKEMTTCLSWWNKNTMRIEVFYDSLVYQQLESNKAYTETDVITDLGGQIGLWLGWSVITAVELVGFLLLVICYCLARIGGPKARKLSDDQIEDDEVVQGLKEAYGTLQWLQLKAKAKVTPVLRKISKKASLYYKFDSNKDDLDLPVYFSS